MRQIGAGATRGKGPWAESGVCETSWHRRLDFEAGPVNEQSAPGWEEEDEIGGGRGGQV